MDADALTRRLAAEPRIALAALPTPLQFCPRLSARLGGPRIYVKREDMTGLGLGGNKIRKLEYVLAEAIAQGADCVVSSGVIQSNSVRQTAAACARLGLAFHAAIITDRVPGVDADYAETGNYLLDALLGMRARVCSIRDDRNAVMAGIARDLQRAGRRPYIAPYGISGVRGALGYAGCALELAAQADALDMQPAAIVHASGTAGTQAGLVVGGAVALPRARVIGIDIDGEPARVRADVVRLARALADHLGVEGADWDTRVQVEAGWTGAAYGVPTPEMVEAVELFARMEGLLLDPVYSGKGAAGLIGLIRAGMFSPADAVIFVHTGGTPALFAYRTTFARQLDESRAG